MLMMIERTTPGHGHCTSVLEQRPHPTYRGTAGVSQGSSAQSASNYFLFVVLVHPLFTDRGYVHFFIIFLLTLFTMFFLGAPNS